MNFFSASVISGSDAERPSNRLREPIVFLKFETSWVFAGSPMALCLIPKEMRDLMVSIKSVKIKKAQGKVQHTV
jgi:hypothetical protein